MEFYLKEKKLIWDFEKNETDARKFKTNNLYIENIWNMKDTVGYADVCVAVTILPNDTFYFVTFLGIGFTMQICENKVICLNKHITK